MNDQEFSEEIERIQEDIKDFSRPNFPCEHFHGREKFFRDDLFERAVDFFMDCQQKKFERKEDHAV